MLDLDERLDELKERGRYRRLRMVSGPQGPRVVLDGRPVLLLCSGNSLGLADHPRVREAAADAAMRWGVGAGRGARGVGDDDAAPAARGAPGQLHRRLRGGLLFGSGTLANLGVIPALARRGEIVLHDELCHPSLVDGCRLAGADAVAYDHCDAEHLAWALRQADGRAALIVTEGLFGLDGDVAPLEEIVRLARRFDVRLLVDESHAIGALGAGRARRAGRRRAGRRGGRGDRLARARARRLRRLRLLRSRDRALPGQQRPHADALDRARARSRWRRRWRRWTCSTSSRAGSSGCATTPPRCATGWPARAST